jgi:DNA-binding NarL/FixJ family response regulator
MAKLRVLIAEDDDDIRQQMVVLLCRDYQVVGAVTNRELLHVASCIQPDVIVSDMSGPRMEGLAARKKLISRGKFIPFVFVFRESEALIDILRKQHSFAFVRRHEITVQLANAVEAVHNAAIYDSPFYPNFSEQQPEDQNIVLIEAETLRSAEHFVLSCEGCNAEAEIPFCEILDRLTGSDPTVTDYILEKPGSCPRCFRAITEKSSVEVKGR